MSRQGPYALAAGSQPKSSDAATRRNIANPGAIVRQLEGKSPNKGAAKPITPAGRWSPDERLVCYQARLATKLIAQTGCGPTNPLDKGTKIEPKQAKHVPVTGLYVANQFGAERLDTLMEAEFCIPSQVAP